MFKTIIQLVKNEDRQFRNAAEIGKTVLRFLLFLIGIDVFLYANQITIHDVVLIRGMYILAICYLFTFYYSKMQFDRKSILLYVIPFTPGQILCFYKMVAFLKCFVQVMLPVCLGVFVEQLVTSQVTMQTVWLSLAETSALYVFASAIVLSVVVTLVAKKYIIFWGNMLFGIAASGYLLQYGLNVASLFIGIVGVLWSLFLFFRYNKYSYKISAIRVTSNGLFQREVQRFVSDRILLLNHVGMCIFSLLFIVNLIATKNELYFITTIMLMLPVMSTSTGSLYSIEGDHIRLIKALPINFYKMIMIKYLVAVIVTIPFYVLNLGMLVYFNRVDLWYCISIIVIVLCTLVFKMIYDRKNSCIEFTNTKQLLENPRKYKMWGGCFLFFLPACFYPMVKAYVICPVVVLVTLLIVWKQQKS